MECSGSSHFVVINSLPKSVNGANLLSHGLRFAAKNIEDLGIVDPSKDSQPMISYGLFSHSKFPEPITRDDTKPLNKHTLTLKAGVKG